MKSNIENLKFYDTKCESTIVENSYVKRIGIVKSGEVEVLCPVSQIDENRYMIDQFPSMSPKIYCAFPMVGSDAKFFPAIMNCSNFIPNTERNGIEISAHDTENRDFVKRAVSAFCTLVQIAEDNKWDGGYNLFRFEKLDFGNVITNKWYNANVFNTIVQKLKTAKLIREGDSFSSVARTYLPYYDKRSNDKNKQLIKIYKFGRKLLTYALPDRKVLFDWYNAVDYELYGAHKLSADEIAKVLANDSKSLATLKKKEEKDPKRTKVLMKFIQYLVDNDKAHLLDKYKLVPNQNENFRLLSKLNIDGISHKLLDFNLIDDLKLLNNEIDKNNDIKDDLIHDEFQSIVSSLIQDRTVTFENLCRLIDDNIKEYKGNYRDKKFVSILKSLFTWINSTKFSDKLIVRYFPYFGNEKSQLYLNTKSSDELEYTFDIDISGKGEALAKMAKSQLTVDEIETIANNSKKVVSFLKWINQKVEDNPDEELGELGEEFLYKELCDLFGIPRVKWEKKREYDFKVLQKDLVGTKYFIDAKTTMKGLGNNDNVPFYMRTAQWNFLENEDAYGKYVIARLEKKGGDFSVKYLKIGIESVD